ncbi:alanine--tRNA ligase [Taylorella equigenitalis]|uniref:alanine--tRNA ligase n=1 Tax=Taylorella equigenitalis TaxID=29575 RepID=UPI00237D2280|nr:alanine--tRNA ligase [Taylorella equigenitalis]WDU55417.1 alanine--tRNA ligase [Taylorella equigenitalis]
MKASEIRHNFLKFFESKNHTIVSSSPLIPANDPTLLFTNAGMVQFKDVFLGKEKRTYSRATTSQKCVRAGGKHNDLENVGYTARHHTFFEMLGNFSFGDYFKEEAITYAWELLTTVFQLPKEKLLVTVYAEDDEAFGIWRDKVGVPEEKIIRIGDNKGSRYASDNFWQMGDTGPCGPCTEIFYDHGPEIWGGPPGSPEEDGDRFIEIWNLVFMQFERDSEGVLHPLPKPCVDTGMGLERIAAVLQHVHSNYEIDLFKNLIKAAAVATNTSDLENNSLKVIADHIRACSFLICDGVIPGKEGRGYVLRRIIRRALRHGHKLGQNKTFFHTLVPALTKEMGEAFPELIEWQDRISSILKQEEDRFQETLDHGMKILESCLSNLEKGQNIDGQTLFILYDTYGFPVDLTADIARERGVGVDLDGFEKAMDKQKETARASGKFKAQENLSYSGTDTSFSGYEHLVESRANIHAIYVDGASVESADEGQEVVVVLDRTPFYAESGGQVGDSGFLIGSDTDKQVSISDTRKITPTVFGHYGRVEKGSIKLNDSVDAIVNAENRVLVTAHHSVTHLMHLALREVLGDHVKQKGSLVDSEKTRFDFSHNSPMTEEEIRKVELLVNNQILMGRDTYVEVMPYDDALKSGAIGLFGEKYGDFVRVMQIGDSRELCGGTHVSNTGQIGLFKIISESGVASGVRRIEAVAGFKALEWIQNTYRVINQSANLLKSSPKDLVSKIKIQIDQISALEKEITHLKQKLISASSGDLLSSLKEVSGIKTLACEVKDVETKALRDLVDQMKSKLGSGVVAIFLVEGDKVTIATGVTKDLTHKLKAGDLVSRLSQILGGKGGGRPDMAMGGGTKVEFLQKAILDVEAWVKELI